MSTRPTTVGSVRHAWGGGRTAWLCGGAALLLYVATAARGVEWQDSAIHQYRVLTGTPEHHLGLALAHPLHYWLGRAALALPLGEPAWRVNLVSAVAGATAVGVLAAVVARLTRSVPCAGLAASVLLVAHSFWQMSAVAESYTLAAALMTIEWWLLLGYVRSRHPAWLVGVLAANGLHVADHLLGLLTLVTYVGLIVERLWRRQLNWRWTPAVALAWLVGSAPYWTLAVGFYTRTGDLGATIYSAFFGGQTVGAGWAGAVLNTSLSASQFKLAALTLGYNFPSLVLPVAIIGLLSRTRGRRRLFLWVMVAQTVLMVGFVSRYAIVDLYTYFVPVCVLLSLWYGLGARRLLRRIRPAWPRNLCAGVLALNAVLAVVVYLAFPPIAAERGWLRQRLREIPFRDPYTHFFRPWRSLDDSPTRFAQAALAATGPGGWFLGDGTVSFTVAYTYRVHGGPQNLRVYAERRWLNPDAAAGGAGTWADQPPLTDEEVARFVASGGRVVVAPGEIMRRTWGERFELDDASAAPFWQIRPGGAGQTGEKQID